MLLIIHARRLKIGLEMGKARMIIPQHSECKNRKVIYVSGTLESWPSEATRRRTDEECAIGDFVRILSEIETLYAMTDDEPART